MKGIQPKRKPDLENKGKLIDDYWSPGQQGRVRHAAFQACDWSVVTHHGLSLVETDMMYNTYWQQMLGDIKFLESLKTYDKDNIPQGMNSQWTK